MIIHTVLRICPSSVFSMHSFSFLKVTFFLTGQFSFSPFRKNHVAFSIWRLFVLSQHLIQCRLRITIIANENVIFLFVITFSFFFIVFLFNWNLEWFTYIKSFVKKRTLDFYFSLLWKKGKLNLCNSPSINCGNKDA